MASKYYDSSGKEVSDGDIAYADDLNSINQAIDSAFQLADTDIAAMGSDVALYAAAASASADSASADAAQTAADRIQTGSDRTSCTNSASSASASAVSASASEGVATTKAALAEKWAEETEDVPVTTGKYSAKHWAAKAASGAGVLTLSGAGVDNTDPNNPVINITKTTLSLNNVDNTSDANKPVSSATQTALDLKAPLASPTLTGTPAAPTATAGTNTTQIATTAFVTTAVASKAALASPEFTGNPTAPTQDTSDDSTRIATTAWVKDAITRSGTTSGYHKSVDGFILQWGTTSASGSGNVTVTFPIAFPNACQSVSVMQTSAYSIFVSKSTTQFVFNTGFAATMYWIAVGY